MFFTCSHLHKLLDSDSFWIKWLFLLFLHLANGSTYICRYTNRHVLSLPLKHKLHQRQVKRANAAGNGGHAVMKMNEGIFTTSVDERCPVKGRLSGSMFLGFFKPVLLPLEILHEFNQIPANLWTSWPVKLSASALFLS